MYGEETPDFSAINILIIYVWQDKQINVPISCMATQFVEKVWKTLYFGGLVKFYSNLKIFFNEIETF